MKRLTPTEALAVTLQFHGSELVAISGQVLIVSPKQARALCARARGHVNTIETALEDFENCGDVEGEVCQ